MSPGTLNIAHESPMRKFFLPTFCRIFAQPVAATIIMDTHAQKRADVKSNQPTTRRGVASSRIFAERKKKMLRQAILSQRSESSEAVIRKRRLSIAVRGWRGELMMRAQACCGFASVSTSITKPFGYIRQHPMSIDSSDALRCFHEKSLQLREVNKIHVVVVIDIERAASCGRVRTAKRRSEAREIVQRDFAGTVEVSGDVAT